MMIFAKKEQQKIINKIRINGRDLVYVFRRSNLSKSLRLSIRADGRVMLSAPSRYSEKKAESFVREKSQWLFEKLDHFNGLKDAKSIKTGPADYVRKKAAAKKIILERVKELNLPYGFKYKKISIRNQKSRWGSCSAMGNLNFNYRLVYLPQEMIDYVIVHELSHLGEMNHSRKFWQLVAKTIPDYLLIKRELKKEGMLLF